MCLSSYGGYVGYRIDPRHAVDSAHREPYFLPPAAEGVAGGEPFAVGGAFSVGCSLSDDILTEVASQLFRTFTPENNFGFAIHVANSERMSFEDGPTGVPLEKHQ